MSEVTYVPWPEDKQIQVGEYDGSAIVCFGYYKVRLPDGFTYMSPHTGFPGTVSDMPVPIDESPEFRRHLVVQAREAKKHHEAESVK